MSGSGNVSTYAIEKLLDLGAIPVTASDSTGYGAPGSLGIHGPVCPYAQQPQRYSGVKLTMPLLPECLLLWRCQTAKQHPAALCFHSWPMSWSDDGHAVQSMRRMGSPGKSWPTSSTSRSPSAAPSRTTTAVTPPSRILPKQAAAVPTSLCIFCGQQSACMASCARSCVTESKTGSTGQAEPAVLAGQASTLPASAAGTWTATWTWPSQAPPRMRSRSRMPRSW